MLPAAAAAGWAQAPSPASAGRRATEGAPDPMRVQGDDVSPKHARDQRRRPGQPPEQPHRRASRGRDGALPRAGGASALQRDTTPCARPARGATADTPAVRRRP